MINLNKKRPGPWDDDFPKENDNYDKCVSCDEVTQYSRFDHVDYRIGYIEGAGQLCLNCYDEIYVKKKNNNNDDTGSQYIVGQYAHNNSE